MTNDNYKCQAHVLERAFFYRLDLSLGQKFAVRHPNFVHGCHQPLRLIIFVKPQQTKCVRLFKSPRVLFSVRTPFSRTVMCCLGWTPASNLLKESQKRQDKLTRLAQLCKPLNFLWRSNCWKTGYLTSRSVLVWAKYLGPVESSPIWSVLFVENVLLQR